MKKVGRAKEQDYALCLSSLLAAFLSALYALRILILVALIIPVLVLDSFAEATESQFFQDHQPFVDLIEGDQGDLASVTYQAEPEKSGKDIRGNSDQLSFETSSLVPLSADLFLSLGFEYSRTHYSIDQPVQGLLSGETTLDKIAAEIGVGYFFCSDLLGYASLLPGHYESDEHFAFQTAATYRLFPNFALVGGAFALDLENGNTYYPVGGFIWRDEQSGLQIRAVLPDEVKLSVPVTNALVMRLSYTNDGDVYTIKEIDGKKDIRIDRESVALGISIDLSDNIALDLNGGMYISDAARSANGHGLIFALHDTPFAGATLRLNYDSP